MVFNNFSDLATPSEDLQEVYTSDSLLFISDVYKLEFKFLL